MSEWHRGMGYSFKSQKGKRVYMYSQRYLANILFSEICWARKLIYTSSLYYVTLKNLKMRLSKAICTFTPGLLPSCLHWSVCGQELLWVSNHLDGSPLVVLLFVSFPFGIRAPVQVHCTQQGLLNEKKARTIICLDPDIVSPLIQPETTLDFCEPRLKTNLY